MTRSQRRGQRLVAGFAAFGMSAAMLVGSSSASAEPISLPSGIHFGPQTISQHGQFIHILTDSPAGTPIQVFVNGRLRVTTPLLQYPTGDEYIRYDRAWGLGTLQLRAGTTASRVEPMLAAVDLGRYELKRMGPGAKKVRVKITARRYDPTTNRWVKAPRPLLQAKQGKWKTVRKIKLNKSGKGKVMLRPKRALRYRFVVNRTSKDFRTVTHTMGKF